MTRSLKIFLLFYLFTTIISVDEILSPFQQSHNINEEDISDAKSDDNTDFCSQVYEKKHSNWLPTNYIFNAKCACQSIPSTSKEGTCIRQFLADRLDDNSRYTSDFKFKLSSLKTSGKGYTDFLMKEFVPMIQQDHFDAYKACGCTGTPAGDWAWKHVAKYKYPCDLIKLGIKFMEGCHGVIDGWKSESNTMSIEANGAIIDKVLAKDSNIEDIVLDEKEIEKEERKDFTALLEMIGALLFSLIIIYSAYLFCRQRQVGKLEDDIDRLNENYYNQDVVYVSNSLDSLTLGPKHYRTIPM